MDLETTREILVNAIAWAVVLYVGWWLFGRDDDDD